MKAAIYGQFQQPVSIQKVPDPTPSPNAVVIKVEATGLCLSDWHGWMGHDPDIVLPNVPGHELAGIIVAVGTSVKKWKPGQRVTVPFVGGCGKCEQCRSDNQQVCDHQFQPGFTAWGSFAQFVEIKYADENIVAIPDDMDFVSAASLGCRFITAYRAVRDQGNLRSDQFIAIHGCGGVGLSAIQIARALGAIVIAIDRTEEKCSLARELGADFTINANTTKVVEAVQELSKGGVHLSINALGHAGSCINSLESLRKRGRHVQVGLMTGAHAKPEIPMSLIIAKELELVGSHGMQAHGYPAMFNLMQSAGIDVSKMVKKTISLEQVPEY
ncbi:MAG TPA: zinc-dependent alcohol dehydrogenase family protein, partial [Eudoraea sp.]|nr:zinc-dependent alcohol dehydrogenase family protein [Eudoraea sp.]